MPADDAGEDTPSLRDSIDDRAGHYGWQDGRAGRPSRRDLVSIFLVGTYDRNYRAGQRSRAEISLVAAEVDFHSRSAAIGLDF